MHALGSRYGRPPSWWLHRPESELLFDLECLIEGTESEERARKRRRG